MNVVKKIVGVVTRWTSFLAGVLLFLLWLTNLVLLRLGRPELVEISTGVMLATILFLLLAFGAGLTKEVDRLRDDFKTMAERAFLDPKPFVPERLLEDYEGRVTRVFQDAVGCLDGTLRIELIADFGPYYTGFFARYPKATFLAVARPGERIWDHKELFSIMEKFIEEGGSIRRIFAVEDPHAPTNAEKDVLDKHVECGVEVRLTREAGLDEDVKAFIVESSGEIIMSAETTEGRLKAVNISVSKKIVRAWKKKFKRLEANSVPYPDTTTAEAP